jgi:hypothetical protein
MRPVCDTCRGEAYFELTNGWAVRQSCRTCLADGVTYQLSAPEARVEVRRLRHTEPAAA